MWQNVTLVPLGASFKFVADVLLTDTRVFSHRELDRVFPHREFGLYISFLEKNLLSCILYWPFDFTCMCNWMMINILSKSLVCWFIKIFGLWTDLLMLTYLQHVKPLNYCNIYTWNRPVHLLEYYCYTWNRPVHLVKYTGSSIPAFLLALSIEETYQCITCITLICTGVLHV